MDSSQAGASTIRTMLSLQEKAMRGKLELARGSLQHNTSKGDQLEIATRRWLRSVLPGNLWVGHGEIIDTAGRRSGQHDVIIAFESHPRFFDEETPQVFFVEGVAAVLEVKTSLNRQELNRTLRLGQRLRGPQHYASGNEIDLNGGKIVAAPDMPDQFSFTVSPPFALFAYESRQAVCAIPAIANASPVRSLDAVFVLEEVGSESSTPGGWCAHYREGNFRQRLIKDGTAVVGWHHHHEDLVLAALLTWLTGTINYANYSNGIMSLYWEAARHSRPGQPST